MIQQHWLQLLQRGHWRQTTALVLKRAAATMEGLETNAASLEALETVAAARVPGMAEPQGVWASAAQEQKLLTRHEKLDSAWTLTRQVELDWARLPTRHMEQESEMRGSGPLDS